MERKTHTLVDGTMEAVGRIFFFFAHLFSLHSIGSGFCRAKEKRICLVQSRHHLWVHGFLNLFAEGIAGL